ncbi:hypothetical protein PMZ80_008752 [Knufia obscura]|uniref:Uncharacterized protein n=2 Tax=Knufia TaxID=430999 RepID=A0AAN8EGR9_9EURO|nr:hypothetical protein PMZ80_008752 [Knufia obscura]KAK5955284.1 hypothetical protein OHC33_003966 [Knufia fluminis]
MPVIGKRLFLCGTSVSHKSQSHGLVSTSSALSARVTLTEAGLTVTALVDDAACIHKETNDYFANGVPTGKLIPDKDGDHITAEFFRPKEKDWVVFHLYVKQVRNQGKLTYVPNNGVKNNPRIYFETKSATPTSVIKAGDKQETCRV